MADRIEAGQVVRLPDGRTGRFVTAKAHRGAARSRGAKARVQLPSGAFLSVPITDLEPVENPRPPAAGLALSERDQ
jgi:hypothetical protein